jgi:hypothetical protein
MIENLHVAVPFYFRLRLETRNQQQGLIQGCCFIMPLMNHAYILSILYLLGVDIYFVQKIFKSSVHGQPPPLRPNFFFHIQPPRRCPSLATAELTLFHRLYIVPRRAAASRIGALLCPQRSLPRSSAHPQHRRTSGMPAGTDGLPSSVGRHRRHEAPGHVAASLLAAKPLTLPPGTRNLFVQMAEQSQAC